MGGYQKCRFRAGLCMWGVFRQRLPHSPVLHDGKTRSNRPYPVTKNILTCLSGTTEPTVMQPKHAQRGLLTSTPPGTRASHAHTQDQRAGTHWTSSTSAYQPALPSPFNATQTLNWGDRFEPCLLFHFTIKPFLFSHLMSQRWLLRAPGSEPGSAPPPGPAAAGGPLSAYARRLGHFT